jgi:hypothetical protein
MPSGSSSDAAKNRSQACGAWRQVTRTTRGEDDGGSWLGAENLLQPLNRDQQRVIEVVAQAFEENSWQWPVFDYLEGVLENEGVDAWTALTSFPRHPESSYAAAWWSWRGGAKPQPNEPVGLAILGLHRAEELQSVTPGVVPAFFALVRLLAEWRKRRPLSATEPRNLRISSDLVISALKERDVAENFLSPDAPTMQPPPMAASHTRRYGAEALLPARSFRSEARTSRCD